MKFKKIKTRFFLFIILANIPSLVFSADTSFVLRLIGHWNNESIPTLGTQRFNDIWGWTAPDNREYVIMGSIDSVYFFDVTDPGNPVLADVHAGRSQDAVNRSVRTYKNYCYAVADQGFGSLQIFDLSFLPDSVHKVYDSDSITIRTHTIFIENDRLYLNSNSTHSGYYAMSVASLADPENPQLLSHLIPPSVNGQQMFHRVHDNFVRNDTAYLSAENFGIFIYDYRNPLAPSLISSITFYPHQGYNHSNWLTDDSRYIIFADENHGLKLKTYDISNIKSPKFVNTFGVNSSAGSIAHNPYVKGNLLFVAYYHEGVQVFDITDPEIPQLIASYDTHPQNIGYSGYEGCWGAYPYFPSGTIAAADMTNGLFLLRLDTIITLPPTEDLLFVYPNPFKTTFTVEFISTTEKPVFFRIYDVTGRFVEEMRMDLKTGSNIITEFPWNPTLSNGLYLFRVKTDNFERTLKLVMDR
jgi:choice-of-anchor B domain-containing protein